MSAPRRMDTQPLYSPASSPRLQVPYNSPANGIQQSDRVQSNVHSRALEENPSKIYQHTNTNGFALPEQPVTRLKHNTGFPLLRPNGPGNNSQSQMDEANTSIFPGQSQAYDQDTHSNFRNDLRQQPSYGLYHDFDQQRAYSQQLDSRHQVNYGAQNDYNQDATGVRRPPLIKEWVSNLNTGR
jgi:hypothetical protein